MNPDASGADMRFGPKEPVILDICSVLERYPQVQGAILYGSRAKGNYKSGSDIDLTLLGGEDLNDAVLANIDADLDDLLLPYTFDLSMLRQISDPDVLGHIRRVGVVFYEKGARAPEGLKPDADTRERPP